MLCRRPSGDGIDEADSRRVVVACWCRRCLFHARLEHSTPRLVHIGDFLLHVGRGHGLGVGFLQAGVDGGLELLADAVLGGFGEDAFVQQPFS